MNLDESKTCISFEVPGEAVSFGTKSTVFKRNGQVIRGTRKTDAAADWEASVRLAAANAYKGDLIGGPVEVRWRAVFSLPKSKWLKRKKRPSSWKTTKPDIDKIERLILDALAGVVYVHDGQVARVVGEKGIGKQGDQARTEIEVIALDNEV